MSYKKLRFDVPDRNGHSECHKLHIGRHDICCPKLYVHGTVMEEVVEDEYLGDVISIDGRNKKNIKKRLSRGLGIISEIMNLMKQFFSVIIMLKLHFFCANHSFWEAS